MKYKFYQRPDSGIEFEKSEKQFFGIDFWIYDNWDLCDIDVHFVRTFDDIIIVGVYLLNNVSIVDENGVRCKKLPHGRDIMKTAYWSPDKAEMIKKLL